MPKKKMFRLKRDDWGFWELFQKRSGWFNFSRYHFTPSYSGSYAGMLEYLRLVNGEIE